MLQEKEVKKIRKKFESMLREEGYSYESLDRDEFGYVMWDVELMWGGFTAGYMAAKEEENDE